MSSASKKLLKELPSVRAMNEIISDLKSKGPQATAIMGAAYLEHAIEMLIKTHFRSLPKKEDNDRLFSGAAGGALGAFSNKIRIAYAAQLIQQEVYDALLLINDIRNVFAHSLHLVNFDNELVAQDCARLVKIAPTIANAAGLILHPLDHPWDIFSRFVSLLYRSIRYEVECLNESALGDDDDDDDDISEYELFSEIRSFEERYEAYRQRACKDEERRHEDD